jgi:DNA-binding transcriptional LysR family regulator
MRPALIPQLDLVTLRLFVAVCEERSIKRAAVREHIAVSALSRRMSDLETALRTTLLRRHARGVEPTPTALPLLHHARIIMRDIAQMQSELADSITGVKGTIRLHANIWAIAEYIPGQLRSFLAEHPQISVEIEESLSSAIITAVSDQVADIGIIGSNVVANGLHVLPYCSDRLVVVMHTDHPLAGRSSLRLAELLPYDVIGAKRGSALDQLVMGGMAELGEALRIRVRISGFDTLYRMAEAGLGVGLGPSASAARYCSTMRLVMVPLDETWAERQLNICVATGKLPPHVQLLVEHLRLHR